MKVITYFLSLLAASMLVQLNTYAQTYTYVLSGNPVNTTGWNMGGNAFINGGDIALTASMGGQQGFIYYNTPVELAANCTYFTVQFDFKMQTASGVTPADGLAFFYITNPPTGFGSGGSIGLPSNMNGMALILDTYSNDNNVNPQNNPLISLRTFAGMNYDEGTAAGLVTPDIINQHYLYDGNWHTCLIEYEAGMIKVFLDGSTTPITQGAANLSMTGYFGFTASTGLYYESHNIKNVIISGGSAPAALGVTNQEICTGESLVPFTFTNTVPGAIIHWYTSATGGTSTLTAPTINPNIPGSYTYYVTQSYANCPLESVRVPITINVNALPDMFLYPEVGAVCEGGSITLTATGAQSYVWTPATGLDNANSGVVICTPPYDLSYTVKGTSSKGCKSERYIDVKLHKSYETSITAEINEGEYYMFNDQRLNTPGTYKAQYYTKYGCDSTINLELKVNYKDIKVMTPNAFSPNGDGVNDRFRLAINDPRFVTISYMKIFNRYGQMVFNAIGDKALRGWDGTFNNTAVDAGVYYYIVEWELSNKKREIKKGEIALIR